MTIKRIHVQAIASHRNGVGGAPFYVVIFRDTHVRHQAGKVAVVFDEPWHTAVLDITKLAQGDIVFGSNSWRGDEYEPHLRRAIQRFNEHGN